MKRLALLKHLRLHGCYLKREGHVPIHFGAIHKQAMLRPFHDIPKSPKVSKKKLSDAVNS